MTRDHRNVITKTVETIKEMADKLEEYYVGRWEDLGEEAGEGMILMGIKGIFMVLLGTAEVCLTGERREHFYAFVMDSVVTFAPPRPSGSQADHMDN